MYFQPFAEFIHHSLKVSSLFCTDIHIIIKILRRKNLLCRSLPRKPQDMASGIIQKITLRNPYQSKLLRIFIGIYYDSMAQSLRERKSYFIPYFPIKSQKLQSIFRQGQFHGIFGQPSFRKTGICGSRGYPTVPIFHQIQRKLVIQFLISQRNKASCIRQAGIIFQYLCLFFRKLYKGCVTVSADSNCLLLAHGREDTYGLSCRSGHHSRQNHRNQN